MMITLTGHTLTVEEMKRLLLEGEGVTACPTSMQKGSRMPRSS